MRWRNFPGNCMCVLQLLHVNVSGLSKPMQPAPFSWQPTQPLLKSTAYDVFVYFLSAPGRIPFRMLRGRIDVYEGSDSWIYYTSREDKGFLGAQTQYTFNDVVCSILKELRARKKDLPCHDDED